MPLTEKEIRQFVVCGPNYDPAVLAATGQRRDKLLQEARSNATAYYEGVLSDIRQSGFRVTARVRDRVWYLLREIENRAISPRVIPVEAVAQIAMTSGGELRHPRVIMNDQVMQWVGIGWHDHGKATKADKRALPLVVDQVCDEGG